MTRGLDAAEIAHIESEKIKPTWLVALSFDAGDSLVTTAPFSLFFDYDGDGSDEEFIGHGDAAGITAIEENLDGKAHEIELSLVVDAARLSLALNEHIQGRAVRLWVTWLDDDNDFIGVPQFRFEGVMDTMPFKFGDDGKTATISLRVISRDVIWERAPDTPRYSDADQQKNFPGDTFFSRVAEINGGREVAWGVDF
jgi:hypothetical protein